MKHKMDDFDLNAALQESAQEAVKIASGQQKATMHNIMVSSGLDVKKIRKMLDMSRATFSETFGLKMRTIEKWEQGKNKMDATARAYLTAIANNPEAIKKALRAAN